LRYPIKKSTLHRIIACSKALEIKLKIFKHKISFTEKLKQYAQAITTLIK